jgi:hypothetical protein
MNWSDLSAVIIVFAQTCLNETRLYFSTLSFGLLNADRKAKRCCKSLLSTRARV